MESPRRSHSTWPHCSVVMQRKTQQCWLETVNSNPVTLPEDTESQAMPLNTGCWLQSSCILCPIQRGCSGSQLSFLVHEKFPHSLHFPIFSWWLTVLVTSEENDLSAAEWPACFAGPSLISGSPCLQPAVQTLPLSLKPCGPVLYSLSYIFLTCYKISFQKLSFIGLFLMRVVDQSKNVACCTCHYQRIPQGVSDVSTHVPSSQANCNYD